MLNDWISKEQQQQHIWEKSKADKRNCEHINLLGEKNEEEKMKSMCQWTRLSFMIFSNKSKQQQKNIVKKEKFPSLDKIHYDANYQIAL